MKTLYTPNKNHVGIGTSLRGYINASYDQLVEVLGEPSNTEPSGDDKVQKQWIVEYNKEFYTVYDWKTYSEEITLNVLHEFNVGAKGNADDFISELESKIAVNGLLKSFYKY